MSITKKISHGYSDKIIYYYVDDILIKKEIYNNSNILTKQSYFNTNSNFNEIYPINLNFDEFGRIYSLDWYDPNYETNRKDDLPSNINYSEEGYVTSLRWFNKNNGFHRSGDKPALIQYDTKGRLKYVKYFKNDYLHRENAPAEIQYYKSGRVFTENYNKNINMHRVNGPAMTRYYDEDNKIFSERWFYEHHECTDNVNEWMKENNFDNWQNMCESDFDRMWMEIL